MKKAIQISLQTHKEEDQRRRAEAKTTNHMLKIKYEKMKNKIFGEYYNVFSVEDLRALQGRLEEELDDMKAAIREAVEIQDCINRLNC